MTFGSHACGNIEWSFGDHLPTPKVEFWWVGPLEVIISVGWKAICRIPQHFLPSSPTATCWESTEKWKMELTCDSGLRNQPSWCLFRTTASTRRPSNWRETTRALRLGTSVSAGLGFLGQPNPRKHGRTIQTLLWSQVEKQNLFGSQNYNDTMRRVSTEPWEGWFQTDYEAILIAKCWKW